MVKDHYVRRDNIDCHSHQANHDFHSHQQNHTYSLHLGHQLLMHFYLQVGPVLQASCPHPGGSEAQQSFVPIKVPNLDFHFSDYISDFLIKSNKSVIMNTIPIQTMDSSNCGKHCLVFCYVMSFEKSVNQYKRWLQTFSSYNIQEREELSLAYFELMESNSVFT